MIADAEKIEITDEALFVIARTVDGGLRDALQLLGQVSLLNGKVTASQVIELAGGIAEAELLGILDAIASNNLFKLLQSARELVDSGKSPKLIVSSLLQVYRDLLILKSVPKAADLIVGAVSYGSLKRFIQGWNHETINASLGHLQRSEAQFRQSTNVSIWVEVCLLNLITELSAQPANFDVVGNAQKTQFSSNPTEVWQRVMGAASPTARKLLGKAMLTAMRGTQAIVQVESGYLNKFETHADKISKMLQKAVGTHQAIVVSFKER